MNKNRIIVAVSVFAVIGMFLVTSAIPSVDAATEEEDSKEYRMFNVYKYEFKAEKNISKINNYVYTFIKDSAAEKQYLKHLSDNSVSKPSMYSGSYNAGDNISVYYESAKLQNYIYTSIEYKDGDTDVLYSYYPKILFESTLPTFVFMPGNIGKILVEYGSEIQYMEIAAYNNSNPDVKIKSGTEVEFNPENYGTYIFLPTMNVNSSWAEFSYKVEGTYDRSVGNDGMTLIAIFGIIGIILIIPPIISIKKPKWSK